MIWLIHGCMCAHICMLHTKSICCITGQNHWSNSCPGEYEFDPRIQAFCLHVYRAAIRQVKYAHSLKCVVCCKNCRVYVYESYALQLAESTRFTYTSKHGLANTQIAAAWSI